MSSKEYKQEQQRLLLEIKSYSTDSKVEQFAAKEVLELVGFRIPGQGLNSNEYLKIKKFFHSILFL